MSSSLFAPPSPSGPDSDMDIDAPSDSESDPLAEADTDGSRVLSPPISLSDAFADLRRRLRILDKDIVHSRDVAVRAEYARRLASGSVLFRALSLELARSANDFAPISSLPMEVFLMIATVVSLSEPPHGPSRAIVPGSNPPQTILVNASLGWVRLLHVCTVWRTTLSKVFGLWAQHVGTLPKAFADFLLRSGTTMPLTISLDFCCWSRLPLLPTFVEKTPFRRVRSMTWKFRSANDAAWLLKALGSKPFEKYTLFPILEYIEICVTAPQSALRDSDISPIHAPLLRTLKLDRVPCVPFVASRLTCLTLRCSPVSIPALGTLIGQCAALASIKFLDCIMSQDQAITVARCRPEHLKLFVLRGCRLETDDFTDDHSIYDIFSTYLDLPPSTRLVLFPPVYAITPETSQDLISRFQSRLRSAIRMCMSLSSQDDPISGIQFLPNELRLVSWSGFNNEDCLLEPLTLTTRARIRHSYNIAFAQALGEAFTSFDHGHVTLLDIHIEDVLPWNPILTAFPNVRMLRIGKKGSQHILSQGRLRRNQQGTFEVDLEKAFSPHLMLLWLDDTALRTVYDVTTMRASILLTLQARRSLWAGAGPRIIYLQSAVHQTPDIVEYIQKLRNLVPDVGVSQRMLWEGDPVSDELDVSF
ncbi:hypothetical protein PENSPDRAFT_755458 [Peniophora sp. CONT]|nr:hypothetical protein PENSPDRAFT_755458 [Peniophora sp. CONT]